MDSCTKETTCHSSPHIVSIGIIIKNPNLYVLHDSESTWNKVRILHSSRPPWGPQFRRMGTLSWLEREARKRKQPELRRQARKLVLAELRRLRNVLRRKRRISRNQIQKEMNSISNDIRGINERIRNHDRDIRLLQNTLVTLKPDSKSLKENIELHLRTAKQLKSELKELLSRLNNLQKEYICNGGRVLGKLESGIEKHGEKITTATRIFKGENCRLFGFPCRRPIERVAPVVVFLDLFTIPCNVDSIASLCTLYVRNSFAVLFFETNTYLSYPYIIIQCCDPERNDHIFCNSHLDCY